MAKKDVKDLKVSGKVVFVRCDFNVPHKGDIITDNNRIVAAIPTIAELVNKGAKILLTSHLGKVDFKKTPEEIDAMKKKGDLSIIVPELKAQLEKAVGHKVNVTFCPATRGEELANAVKALKDGEIVLMQNTRYEKGETKNDPELAKEWAALADAYVNDAFGSDHRAHVSTYGVPELLRAEGKPTAVGYLVEKEIVSLGRCVECPKEGKPYVAILGGAKVSDKILVIESLLKKCDKILIGGAMAYTFLKALGHEIGTSLVENDQLDYAKKIYESGKIVLPVDNKVAYVYPEDDNATGTVVPSDDLPADQMGLDIGPETAKLYGKIISEAKTVFWNGPMGVSEVPAFADGTIAVCKAAADNEAAFTVIGGGDSAAAAKKLGFAAKFDHVSTGGGASLELIQNDGHLPGIDIIEDK